MAAATRRPIARCREAFAGFARVSHYLGAFGNGSRMKFVANLLVAVHNAAAAEAIVLGTKAGLDPERILEVIGSGAGNSRIFELRGPMMAKGVYTPPTATMHVLQKDSAIIAEFARALGVDTPMLDAAAPLYDEAEAQGYGEEDVGAVHAVLARRAGIDKTGIETRNRTPVCRCGPAPVRVSVPGPGGCITPGSSPRSPL